jgi:pilus assembly protein CpaE
MRRLSFLVFSQSSDVHSSLAEALLATGQATIQASVSLESSLPQELRRHRVDALYIDLDPDPKPIFEAISNLPEPRPLLLFGSNQSDPQLLLRAMRLGARDFFVGHNLESLESVIRHAVPELPVSTGAAPILAVVGAKGGVGATLIACELGVALQESGTRVLVCDLNLRLGDVPLYFDLRPLYSVADIAKKEGTLDMTFVNAVLAEHSSNVSVLAAPAHLEDIGSLNSSQLERILRFVQREFDCIILDLPWGFDDLSSRALEISSHILLVTTPDVPSLTHARTRLGLMERFGTSRDRVHVVLNRHSNMATFDKQYVVDFLGCDVDAVIPDHPAATQQCMNEGLLLRDAQGGEEMERALQLLRDRTNDWCQFERSHAGESPGSRHFVSRLRKLVTRR